MEMETLEAIEYEEKPQPDYEGIIEDLKSQIEKLKKDKSFYYEQYLEYMQEAVKYRSAFKVLVEEALKK